MSLSPSYPVSHATFTVDAAVWDMDGTMVDSIAAVEAAWTSVANELGQDAAAVIAATHGKRAIDNLRDLKPHLRRLTNEQMEEHVENFERRILLEADEFQVKVRSRRNSSAGSSVNGRSRRASSSAGMNPLLAGGMFSLSKIDTPVSDSPARDAGSNPADPMENLTDKLARLSNTTNLSSPFDDDEEDDEFDPNGPIDFSDYTEEEIGCADKSVRILPGVRRLVDSLPKDRFAVATSGAKTYCHGALHRAGIQRPAVTITADDPRLLRGKPFPDPFLLAAKEIGYDIKKCVIFEDSPSGIIAAVASGATTVAVCTSHPVEKISHCGAHYIVPSLDCVFTKINKDGTIQITIDAHAPNHPLHGAKGSHSALTALGSKLSSEIRIIAPAVQIPAPAEVSA